MNVMGAGLVVLLFLFVLERAGLPGMAREAWERSTANLDIVRDPSLTDEQKEKALRRAAPGLVGLLAKFVIGGAAALLLPLAALWLLDRLGWMSYDGVLALLVRWEVILGLTVLGVVAGGWAARRSSRREW